jgi:hypothetical protein
MRICDITLAEIMEAFARECPSAMKAALGIFLAIMAGGRANAGPNSKEVPRVAFLGFEFINTSLIVETRQTALWRRPALPEPQCARCAGCLCVRARPVAPPRERRGLFVPNIQPALAVYLKGTRED